MAADRSRWRFSLLGILAVISGICVWFAIGRVVGFEFLVWIVSCSAAFVGFGLLAGIACALYVPNKRMRRWSLRSTFWDSMGVVAEEPWPAYGFSDRLPEFLMKKSEVQNDRR